MFHHSSLFAFFLPGNIPCVRNLFTFKHPILHQPCQWHLHAISAPNSRRSRRSPWSLGKHSSRPSQPSKTWPDRLDRGDGQAPVYSHAKGEVCAASCIGSPPQKKTPLEQKKSGGTNQQIQSKTKVSWAHLLCAVTQVTQAVKASEPLHCKRRRSDHEAAVGLAGQ